MLAKDLLSDVIPALKTSDSGMDALNWMEVFRVSHLPIVNNTDFLGLISDTDIYDLNMADEPLGSHELSLFKPYVYYSQHIYDVIEIASRLQLTVIPVLDDNKEFMGVITQSDLLHRFADLIAAHTPGGILELEIKEKDYSLPEIARIIEDAEAKALSFYLTQQEQGDRLSVTIKLNRSDIRPVLSAFDRYGYQVKTTYVGEGANDIKARENYDALMRYLDT